MKLDISVGGDTIPVNVPDNLMNSAEPFFKKMDEDMSRGWQMGRNWVDTPTTVQRCQIAADKILNAIEHENKKLATMMAGYILSRAPGIREIAVSTNGEMEETELISG